MNRTEKLILDYLLKIGPAPWVWFLRDHRENQDGIDFALSILVMEGQVRVEDIRLPDGRQVRVFCHPEGKVVDLGNAEWVRKVIEP